MLAGLPHKIISPSCKPETNYLLKDGFICYDHAQVPYLVKILFLRYGPKCSWRIMLHGFQNNCISGRKQ